MPVPGLGEPYALMDPVLFQEEELQKLDIPIPMHTTAADPPFRKLSCR
jgi:hypothetical protein